MIEKFTGMSPELVTRRVPTDPDVRMLVEKYPPESLEKGTVIAYTAIRELLQGMDPLLEVSPGRFQTVTARWRKHMEDEHQVMIVTGVPGESFKVATDAEQLDARVAKRVSLGRQEAKNVVRLVYIDRRMLPPPDRKRLDHERDLAVKMEHYRMLSEGRGEKQAQPRLPVGTK